jgi:hypothetical protein
MKNRFLVCAVGFCTYAAFSFSAESPPPLAPPSNIVMSREDMILDFKLFVLIDLFQKIVSQQSSEGHDFLALTDAELDFLMKKFMEDVPLWGSQKPKVFFCQQILYIHLDATFLRCYRLEVLPGEFEFKTEKINDGVYKAFFTKKGQK